MTGVNAMLALVVVFGGRVAAAGLHLDKREVEPGDTVSGSAGVARVGAGGGGRLVLRLRSEAHEEIRELAISTDVMKKPSAGFSFVVGKTAPKGEATIELQVFDKAGRGGAVQSAKLTIK